MPSRLRFNRNQITKAFRRGLKAQKPMSKVTIDPDLLNRISQQDQAAVDELINEIDAIIASAFSATPSPVVLNYSAPVVSKSTADDGMNCNKCRNFYQYAESNQPDGTLICYSCRS